MVFSEELLYINNSHRSASDNNFMFTIFNCHLRYGWMAIGSWSIFCLLCCQFSDCIHCTIYWTSHRYRLQCYREYFISICWISNDYLIKYWYFNQFAYLMSLDLLKNSQSLCWHSTFKPIPSKNKFLHLKAPFSWTHEQNSTPARHQFHQIIIKSSTRNRWRKKWNSIHA